MSCQVYRYSTVEVSNAKKEEKGSNDWGRETSSDSAAFFYAMEERPRNFFFREDASSVSTVG
jgi:hypothetical protein